MATDVVDAAARRQRLWLEAAIERARLTPTAFARQINVGAQTITRKLDPDNTALLDLRTIAKISQFSGLPPPTNWTDDVEEVPSFREPEAAPYVAAPRDAMAKPVADFIAGRPGVDPWVLNTRALEYKGYLPGDILIVDSTIVDRAQPQDIVCAQVYDSQLGTAETVWRIYAPPFLIAAGPVPALQEPLSLSDRAVAVRGVVLMMFRRRPGG